MKNSNSTRNSILSILSVCITFLLSAQMQGPGSASPSGGGTPGYVLFAPQNSDTVFLIDKSNNVKNYWVGANTADVGLNAYLLPNGHLLHSQNIRGSMGSGNPGGRVLMTAWDGSPVWSCTINSDTLQQSHDVYPISDSNVLVSAWELIPWSEVEKAGRTCCINDTTGFPGMWSGVVLELSQVGDTAEIVWKWRFWDHLIVDPDYPCTSNPVSTSNLISAHPELLNLNYLGSPNGNYKDWIHMNALCYNPVLKQIMISSRNLNEIYIIEYTGDKCSTAAHSGGTYGKGGDFLYRWGNPAAYCAGDTSQQQFFGQHSPYWLDPYGPNPNHILINNDGFLGWYNYESCMNPNQQIATTFDFLDAPYNASTQSYGMAPYQACGPSSLLSSIKAPTPGTTYNNEFEGNVQQLPNGNLLVCAAKANHKNGLLYEISSTGGEPLWQYNLDGHEGGVFRCYYYSDAYVNKIVEEQKAQRVKGK